MAYKKFFLFLIMPFLFSCTTTRVSESFKTKKEVVKLTINNATRTLLVFYPQGPGPFPLLLAYHGHTGTALKMHEITKFEKLWPQAIVVYPQGLNGDKNSNAGPGTGWQLKRGQNNNRDLLLFDEIVSYFLKNGLADQRRVYVTGQSMGGAHTLFLWLTKSDKITAFAPCAAQLSPQDIEQLSEKPFLMVSGKADDITPFAHQEKIYMVLKSKFSKNQKMEFYVHNGGHPLPAKAPAKIISFFKEIDDEILAQQ